MPPQQKQPATNRQFAAFARQNRSSNKKREEVETGDVYNQRVNACVRKCINHYCRPFSSWFAVLFAQWIALTERHQESLGARIRVLANHFWRESRRNMFPNQKSGQLGTRKRPGRPIRWLIDDIDNYDFTNPNKTPERLETCAQYVYYTVLRWRAPVWVS